MLRQWISSRYLLLDSDYTHYGLYSTYPYLASLNAINSDCEDAGFTRFTVDVVFMRRDISDIDGDGKISDLVEFTDEDGDLIDDFDEDVLYQDVANDLGTGDPASPDPDGDYWDTYTITLDGKNFTASEEPNTHLKKIRVRVYRDSVVFAELSGLISPERFSGEANPASGASLTISVTSPANNSFIYDPANPAFNASSLSTATTYPLSPLTVAGKSAPSATVTVYYGDKTTVADTNSTEIDGTFSFSAGGVSGSLIEGANTLYAKTTKGGSTKSPYTIRNVIYDIKAPNITNSSPPASTTVTSPTPFISAMFSDTPVTSDREVAGVDTETIKFALNGVDIAFMFMEATGEAYVINDTTGLLPFLENGTYTVSLSVDDQAHYQAKKEWDFIVSYDLNDSTIPIITNNTPSVSTGLTNPTISTQIFDAESGINLNTVRMSVDGESVADSTNILNYFRPSNGTISYTPITNLEDGSIHTVTVSAANWAVPPLYASLTWNFEVDLTLVTPPIISHTTPPSVQEGDPITFESIVTDSGGIQTVYLHWEEGDPLCRNMLTVPIGGATSYTTIQTLPTTTTGTLFYYIEAVDTHGNTSYHEIGTDNMTPDVIYNDNPHQVIITSETIPPVIVHVPFTGPVEAGTDPSGIISATVTDNVLVSEVKIFGKGPSDLDYEGGLMTNVGGDVYEAEIPAFYEIGMASYYIYAEDNALPAPNTTRSPVAIGNTFDIVDTTPPVIAHTPVADNRPQTVPIVVSPTISDIVEVASGNLYYRNTGEPTYASESLSLSTGDLKSGTWSATIPGEEVIAGSMEYYLTAVDTASNAIESGSEASPYTFTVAALPNVLIVDDDTCKSGPARADMEIYYKDALEDKGFTLGDNYTVWDTKDNSYLGPDAAYMADYNIVIWFMAGWTEKGLESDDRTALATYLNNGGRLYISGDDLPRDMNDDSSAGEKDFMNDYFRVNFVNREANKWNIIGNNGVDLSNGFSFTQTDRYDITGYNDMKRVKTNEISLIPTPGLEVLFDFDNTSYSSGGTGSEICGVRYDNGTYKVVFLSFGLENMDTATNRRLLMSRIIDWLSI